MERRLGAMVMLMMLTLGACSAQAAEWHWQPLAEALPAGLLGPAVVSEPVKIGNPLLTKICEKLYEVPWAPGEAVVAQPREGGTGPTAFGFWNGPEEYLLLLRRGDVWLRATPDGTEPAVERRLAYFGHQASGQGVDWTGAARIVRSKFLSTREQDFVLAARLYGVNNRRLILRHLIPSFMSYVIVRATLDLPAAILGETSLSFLGIGLRAPALSLGVLLQQAQNIRTVAFFPWLMFPALLLVFAILAYNFLGDGLRDAADPYAR